VSKTLTPQQTLELLEDLRTAVRSISGKVAKLNEEHRTRAARHRLRREAALKEENERLSAALAGAEVEYQNAKATSETHYERRKFRIGKAYQSSKEQRLKEIEKATGTRKYELQKRMLQAERDRDTGLTAATTARQEFQAKLTSAQQELAILEIQVRNNFSGYGGFKALLSGEMELTTAEVAHDEQTILASLRSEMENLQRRLSLFQSKLLLRLIRYFPLWLLLGLAPLGVVPLLQRSNAIAFGYREAAIVTVVFVVLVSAGRFLAMRSARATAESIASSLAKARRLHAAAYERCESHYDQDVKRLHQDYDHSVHAVDQQLKQALGQAGERRVACRMQSDEKTVRATATCERMFAARIRQLEEERPKAVERLQRESTARMAAIHSAAGEQERALGEEFEAQWRVLDEEWRASVEPAYATVRELNLTADELFPPWAQEFCDRWKPPARFSGAAKLGTLEVDFEKLSEIPLAQTRFALPGPVQFSVPVSLTYPAQGSVLIETGETGREQAVGALNNIILRILTTSPPGKMNFTILDPVGLGQSFAGIMHIADYEEQIINSRIWTQSPQIDERLGDLNEHMEKVIQMYLRNEYATIAEYNEQAGVIAEKYHFLVVADFPAGFSDTGIKRLMSIAASGARCGVYTLIHWDRRLPVPQELIPEELRKSSFCIQSRGEEFLVFGKPSPGLRLVLQEPPPADLATQFIHRIGESSRDSSRVEVPFTHVIPPEEEIWSEDTSAELRVPIGRTGATKLQYLAIGKGTRQHGLIAGKTGSGKSTLFHVIITNLALWCSPDQVEFYLVDFKKGVEFKCYATNRLPHARVVAIESDREFGLSVLQRVDEELKRRGDMFRKLGVQDIPGYKRAGGTESIPRSLLIIDEFQEFFVEDDKIAQTASLLLDRIVRQGRAFGIHVLLGSQTLGGAYTVARTTLGQMVIRVALQCNEADAYLIMDDSNPAPRLLSRPGEALYNDAAGAIEGNSPFQVVWLGDRERDTYLAKVREVAVNHKDTRAGPIVFEGNAPAEIGENELLSQLLESGRSQRALAPRIWLGAPNCIKGPTEAIFHRQSGNNLLIVGQRDEAVLAILSIGLLTLAAQHPPGTARIILLDSSPPRTPQRGMLERVIKAVPGGEITLAKQGDLPEIMGELAAEMRKRLEAPDAEGAPAVFLVINGLQKFGKLRYEEDFGFSTPEPDAPVNPAMALNSLVCEGTRLGLHVIAACDTYNNVSRFLSRKALSEFEMRVAFQMSANDSASLLETPRASTLGLHRALFFNEQEGYLETFRPYALPSVEWIEQAGKKLARTFGVDR
jgi:DNA segregation ATPase FtsK/SpoIIIE, S-DNA-T family